MYFTRIVVHDCNKSIHHSACPGSVTIESSLTNFSFLINSYRISRNRSPANSFPIMPIVSCIHNEPLSHLSAPESETRYYSFSAQFIKNLEHFCCSLPCPDWILAISKRKQTVDIIKTINDLLDVKNRETMLG